MKSLRLVVACAILAVAGVLAEVIAGPPIGERQPLRPVEQMLLGSIVGLAICFLWIWISARAGR
ncbi:hypothetical protein ASD64_05630 [Mesorhizobium sp. Root157]|nr:hypothetical protein ASD64_05630 [Mesorhizobium sp. Root157]